MAGYIMNLNSMESLIKCVRTGVYSTDFKPITNNQWNTPKEGTFADYFSMKAGDNIYFFIKRKLYGIGELVNIGEDCKYLNYKDADIPVDLTDDEYRDADPLVDDFGPANRCICTFIPSPFFFERGIDMDEALSSSPASFRMLRAMWKLSFIKIDDEENKALIDIILKRNEESLIMQNNVYSFDDGIHQQIHNRLKPHHFMRPYRILARSSDGIFVKHEMALEAYLCSLLGKENDTPFGKWDYISHQVVASPFKAVDYMDKIDIFGYRYIEGYKTISKYLVAEIKKGTADIDVVEQIMKYVDWVNQEYAHGDYSMIEAFVIASDFPNEVVEKRDKECIRNFVKGFRPAEATTWANVRLIRYEYYDDGIDFIEV